MLHMLDVLQVPAAPLQRECSRVPDDVHAVLLVPNPASSGSSLCNYEEGASRVTSALLY